MIRVLQVYPQMNNAGTERVIFNLYENIDTSKVQFDFLVEREGELDQKIKNMGGHIYYLHEKKNKEYYRSLVKFFECHKEYKIVHTHTHSRMSIVLKAAKKCKVPCRIAHSHNARNDLPKIAGFLKGLTSIPIEMNANCFYACSFNAAKWLFPHKLNSCKILYNGIKLDDYLFNLENRLKIRKELGISDNTFLMIHVGRFAKQKNHEFLVRILENYNGLDSSDWKILLVGDGPLREGIDKEVNVRGLSNHVIFLGNRSDVSSLYSAADIFVFPSLHEGLGIVVIEAQASGLQCIVSEAVPQEADMDIGLIKTLSLKDNITNWTNSILNSKCNIKNRADFNKYIIGGKYDICRVAKEMQEFYVCNGI